MKFLLVYTDYSLLRQAELRRWYFDNGVLFADISGPGVFDSVARTLTVQRRVALDGQENSDFPEFAVGEDQQLLSTTQVVPLQVLPLSWMLTMTGAWRDERSGSPTLARATRRSAG